MSFDEQSEAAIRLSDEDRQRVEVLQNEFLEFKKTRLFQAMLAFHDAEYDRCNKALIEGGTEADMNQHRITLKAIDRYREFVMFMIDNVTHNPVSTEEYQGESVHEQEMGLEPALTNTLIRPIR